MNEIEHRHLRSALEFAVLIAAEGQKRRPPLAYPKELKAYFGAPRVPASALGRIRRAIEADDAFRTAIGAGALPELVDEVGRLWLTQPSGWERTAAAIIDDEQHQAASSDAARDLKRSEKRRLAAEQAAARAGADLVVQRGEVSALRTELDAVRAELVKADEEAAELRVELIDTRNELRHARDREAAAVARAEAARVGAPAPVEAPAPPVAPVAVEPDTAHLADRLDRRELADIRDAAASVIERLDALVDLGPAGSVAAMGDDARRTNDVARRSPVSLPGGTISTSAAAAEHLVRAGATILIDGYNVAKLAWPGRPLDEQRDSLTARLENLARRHDAQITIVFDGTSVVGAHAPARRSVRVMYSPDGVTADDVIRSEVARRPVGESIVVVTNDREIADDVRAAGCNVVPSNALLAVL